jgi:hypothetical protein
MNTYKKRPLIHSRVLLMGEGRIPRDCIDAVSDEHIKIFLREPDPNNWPPEMAHLKAYLPPGEQVKWRIYPVFRRHEVTIKGPLERWARSVWEEVKEDLVVGGEGMALVIEAMADFVKERIETCLDG